MKRAPLQLALVLLLLLGSLGFARVTFELVPFDAGNFRDINKLVETCDAPAASSFWCESLTGELTLIPTKSVDYFFNDAGEMVAVFGKQQKGQNFVTNDGYKQGVDNGQNLVPDRLGSAGRCGATRRRVHRARGCFVQLGAHYRHH